MRALKLFTLIAFCSCYALRAQEPKQIVQQAVDTELAADRTDHSHWIFFETDRKPKNSVQQWVAQTEKGDVVRVLVRNGQHVPANQQSQNLQKFIHDPNAQTKQRQASRHDDQQASAMTRMLPVAFIWTVTSKNDKTTTLHFKPDPNFHPPSWEARAFAGMEGDMTVDNTQHRIQELKGHLIHDVDFGWGLLGKLQKGGSFSVERRQIGPGIWDITDTHVHISGHALIFKSISEQEDDQKSSWTREPDNVTLEQAAAAVMAKPAEGSQLGQNGTGPLPR
ncbi:MAG: hypothetical protein JOZ83_00360 [Silvibacterium sp.]|nr:hypothetical protein [Silvibacterium sp.]